MSSPLISVSELSALLGTVTLPDVRYRMGGPTGRDEFSAGHVPTAAYVDMDTQLSSAPGDPVDERGRHPLPDPDVFLAAMRASGVSADVPVVVYDDWQGRAAGRAWWLLRDYGHPDVRVLDGGWTAWVEAGGSVSTENEPPVVGDFEGRPGTLRVVDASNVADVEVLVDARAPERYRGDVEPIDPVAGHIPGAVNVDTSRNPAPDGTFWSADELRDLYASVGAVPGADVAAYCGSGVTATHDLLALAVAGVDAALYPGSWSGFVARPAR
ncbi:sulfurtransferase [Nocardioides sp. B-3]|uniref:sulfurtransferase n=1 Tax=Nocardioides sp. B-3 TaxID=2895565 RepID=UPI0021532086|nr:sulfurtransferase [Nocardioides sp. B-3]UUZ58919.1 sulfurtransferase [Nocardioides sp. B-3]